MKWFSPDRDNIFFTSWRQFIQLACSILSEDFAPTTQWERILVIIRTHTSFSSMLASGPRTIYLKDSILCDFIHLVYWHEMCFKQFFLFAKQVKCVIRKLISYLQRALHIFCIRCYFRTSSSRKVLLWTCKPCILKASFLYFCFMNSQYEEHSWNHSFVNMCEYIYIYIYMFLYLF